MKEAIIKLIGWKTPILFQDPTVYDRFNWLKRHLKKGNLRTLDAGSGGGGFTVYASKIGNTAVGISFEEEANKRATRRAKIWGATNVKFITQDLRGLDLVSDRIGKFDQIICFETIEHILNDKKLIRDLSNILKPNGILLLTTPFKYYKKLYGETDELSKVEDGGHVRRGYTHTEMRDLFEKYGLQVVTEEYVSGLVSQKITSLMRRLFKINGRLAWIITAPLRIFQIIDVPLTKLINHPFLCIGVVGIKKK